MTQPETARELASLAANAGRALQDEKRHYEIACKENARLRLMVDEYGAGAGALTDKLKRIRDLHRETCPLVQGEMPPGVTCGMCEVLDAPAAVSAAVAPVLPSPEDTAAADESPHIYLTAIRHQAGLAHDFTKAGRMAEALEHVEAVERLLAVYRRAVGAPSVVPADVLNVLARLASPEACRWEGVYCITHSWRSDVGSCPHGEAQQLLGGAA